MREKLFFLFLIIDLLVFGGCGGVVPITGESTPLPIEKANPDEVLDILGLIHILIQPIVIQSAVIVFT